MSDSATQELWGASNLAPVYKWSLQNPWPRRKALAAESRQSWIPSTSRTVLVTIGTSSTILSAQVASQPA
jgi:hypothetical protein